MCTLCLWRGRSARLAATAVSQCPRGTRCGKRDARPPDHASLAPWRQISNVQRLRANLKDLLKDWHPQAQRLAPPGMAPKSCSHLPTYSSQPSSGKKAAEPRQISLRCVKKV